MKIITNEGNLVRVVGAIICCISSSNRSLYVCLVSSSSLLRGHQIDRLPQSIETIILHSMFYVHVYRYERK